MKNRKVINLKDNDILYSDDILNLFKDGKYDEEEFLKWLRYDTSDNENLKSQRLSIYRFLYSKEAKETEVVGSDDFTNELSDTYNKLIRKETWFNPKGILKRQYVFSWRYDELINGTEFHFIKEKLLYNDGTISGKIRLIKDYKVPFWITKPFFRNHKQKKEFEDIKKLDKFMVRTADLPNAVAKALGNSNYRANKRWDVIDSPYVYGLDIDSNIFIKREYFEKYGEPTIPFDYATLDTENDIDTGKLTLITIAMYGKMYTVGTKEFFKDVKGNVPKMVKEYFFNNFVKKYKYDGRIVESKYIAYDVEVADTPTEAIEMAFKRLHSWNPDFLGIWNILHDINLIVDTLTNDGVEPKDVFSHPIIPKKLRFFKVIKGATSRKKENGDEVAVKPNEQWHTIKCSAGFYILDGMSTYTYVRVGSNEVAGGYGLDNILNKEVGLSKMKSNLGEGLKGAEWHNYVSKRHPVGYAAYNAGDTYPMIILENKTKDVTVSMPILSMSSTYDKFNSSPRKIIDELFWDAMSLGKISGTKPRQWEDGKYLDTRNWILTLRSGYNITPGLDVVEENPKAVTLVKGHTADVDATSSYPSNGTASNLSRDTTVGEISTFIGRDEEELKVENMNLFYGPVNSMTYSNNVFRTPSIFELV